MKWIGQHIWDFISRFRNDVYLEDLEEVEQEFTIQVAADGKLTKSTAPSERSRLQVRNDEGSVIPAGAPLYSKGEVGGSNRIKVGICVSSDPAKMPCIGIAQFEMNTSSTKDSFAITQGVYNTNISGFTGLNEGDILYVNGGVAPHLTPTKPTNGDLIQNVGIVLKVGGGGTICQGLLVAAIGRTNDVPWPLYVDGTNQRLGIGITNPSVDLHVDGDTIITGDLTVSGTTTTINTENLNVEDNNITLNYSAGDSSSTAEGSGITIQDAVNSTTDSTFTWGTTNDRFKLSHGLEVLTGNVGIGTTSPSAKLDVNGDVNITGNLDMPDSSLIRLGSSNDLQIYHNGTNSNIVNYAGDLVIRNGAADKDIILQSDDGSGGETAYLTLDGSVVETKFNKDLRVVDNEKIIAGTSNDLEIFSSGASVLFRTWSGNMTFQQNYNDGDIIFQSDDGSGGTSIYMMLDGSESRISTKVNNRFDDNVKLELGTSGDLDLLHDGSNSYIHHNGAGSLYMKADTGDINIINYTNDRDIILQSDDGSGGVTPYLTLDGSDEKVKALKQLQVTGGIELTNSNLNMPDNSRIRLGSSTDLQIYHNGADSVIDNTAGDFYISQKAADKDLIFRADDGAGGFTPYLTLDGSETKTIVSQTMEFQDNVKLAVGNSEDLIIDHNATDSRVINYTGDLRIVNSANDKDITLESDDGSGGITPYLTLDGSAKTANIDVPIKVNDQIVLDSKQAYTLPAQGTRMRILQITNHTLCRLYLESSENSYHQPIVLDIFYKAQSTGSKPQIVRSENYEWHTHSNDIIFTSDGASSPGADTYIYAEKVVYSTGRSVNIRKIEVFDGDLTVLDGSTTDTNGGTDETVESTFSEITSTGKITANTLLEVSKSTGAAVRITSTATGNGADVTLGSLEYYGNDASVPGAGIKSSIVAKTEASLGDDSNLIFSTSDGTTNNVERVRINPSGDVGIGQTDPQTLLHLTTAMSSSPTTQLYLDVDGANTNGGGGEIIFNTSATAGSPTLYNAKITGTRVSGGTGGDSQLGFWTTLVSSSTSPQERMTITKEGNVGIGTTSPTYSLDVETSDNIIARFSSTDNKGAIAVKDDDTTAYISAENSRIGFGTSPALSTQNITMLTGNNFVGIGVISPAVKLDVAGDAQLQGTSPRLVIKETGTSKDFSLKVQTDGRFSVLNDNLASEVLTIEQGGNVGIGTSNPAKKLHISDSSRVDIKFTTVGSEEHYIRKDGDFLRFRGHDDSAVLFELKNNTNGSNAASFPSGNLGIGTTSPSTRLHVSNVSSNDQLTLERTGTFTGKYTLHTANNNFYIGNNVAGSIPLAILNNGNVGIGTTSPSQGLHVVDAGIITSEFESSDNSSSLIEVSNNAGLDAFFGVAGGNLVLRHDDYTANHFAMDSSGNVGIGTSSPGQKLHVNGNIRVGNGTDAFYGNRFTALSNADVELRSNNGYNLILNANAGDNVGIGTASPAYKLDVRNSSTLFYGQTNLTDSTSIFRIRANGGSSEILEIKANGNIGIGTSSPGEKLDVAGDIKLSGDIELGHASDTTIARASAGKVTIEGAPIQTTQMSMSHHNFYFNTSSTTIDYFVPFNSLTESSNPTITNYYGRMVAPYDGKIVKAVINTTAAIGTACSAQFWVATSSGVFAPSPAETVSNINLNTANTAATATFSGTSTAEFSEGDVVGLSIQKSGTTSTAYIQVTIVWEYTV